MTHNKMDLTAFDASTQENAKEVIRKPVPFLCKIENGVAVLIKIESGKVQGRENRIPKAVFDSQFIRWPNSKESSSIYCKKPGKSFAIQISFDFYTIDFGFDDEIKKESGKAGDFLITRESSGVNEICNKEDFDKLFISESQFYSIEDEIDQGLSNI